MIGRILETMYAIYTVPTTAAIKMARFCNIERNRMTSPAKNRPRDRCRMTGRMPINSGTCQSCRPTYRAWRTSARLRASPDVTAMYWYSHCFAKTPRNAVRRLSVKLMNHRLLSQMSEEEGANGVAELSEDGTSLPEDPLAIAR